MIILGALPLWITGEYTYSIRMESTGGPSARMRNVNDLFGFVQAINSKKLFRLTKNIMWYGVCVWLLWNYFIIIYAHVGLIKSSKFQVNLKTRWLSCVNVLFKRWVSIKKIQTWNNYKKQKILKIVWNYSYETENTD